MLFNKKTYQDYRISLTLAANQIDKKRKHLLIFALKEFVKKSFTKSLIISKARKFSISTLKNKSFTALKNFTNLSLIKKSSLIKSVLHYETAQKSLVFSVFKHNYEMSYVKQIKQIKALKFWSYSIKYKFFGLISQYRRKRLKKKNSIKEAQLLRMFDLQQDILKKWITAGVYWSEKNEKENIERLRKKEERVWKTVQRCAEVWLGKIRKGIVGCGKQEVFVPKVQNTKQEVYDICVEFKKRPEPRRINCLFSVAK